MSTERSIIERARMASLEPFTDAPQTTGEWLRALELGGDAAVRLVLEHLKGEFEARALALFHADGDGSEWQEAHCIVDELLRDPRS